MADYYVDKKFFLKNGIEIDRAKLPACLSLQGSSNIISCKNKCAAHLNCGFHKDRVITINYDQ